MFDRSIFRSPIGLFVGFALGAATTGVGAATIHRFAVSQTTGSGGATTFLQTGASSSALQGEVASSARTSIKVPFGILGEYDAPGSTFGIGVAAISTTGYGVGAEALGSLPAVLALNGGAGDGIDAFADGAGLAIYAQSQVGGTGAAIEAQGYKGNAIRAFGESNAHASIYSEADSATMGFAVSGISYSKGGFAIGGYGQPPSGTTTGGGMGLYAEGQSATVGVPVLEAEADATGTDLFDTLVYGSVATNSAYNTLTVGYPSANLSGTVDNSQDASSDLMLNGDVYVSGNVYSDCTGAPGPSPTCMDSLNAASRTSQGGELKTYAAHQAVPTMEDAGQAQLTRGFAHIALEPRFASLISTKQPYLVFTTPQGDNRGLYVTNITAQGFDVRESAGGRSTIAFDYRIVAQPYGDSSARLPRVTRQSGTVRPVPFGIAHDLRLAKAEMLQMHGARSSRTRPRSIATFERTRGGPGGG